MKEEYFYAVSTLAWGASLLLAAALVWVSLTAPERDRLDLIWGTVTLVASLGIVVGSIRKKRISGSFGARPWSNWLNLAVGLLVFLGLAVRLFFAVFR